MKPVLGLFAVLTWLTRCQGIELPEVGQAPATSHPEPDAELMADAGAPSAEDAAADGGELACDGPPGLYVDVTCRRVGPGLRAYRPRYELWSDGASKERYIYLPPGAQVDTQNPDRWTFPVGTRLYKTFSLAGVRLETRVMEKVAPAPGIESWKLAAYAWNEAGDRALPAAVSGVADALGTEHDIPSEAQCKSCHQVNGADAVNGFGAIQLNHAGAGVTLAELLEAGELVNPSGAANISLAAARIPGDELAQAALGYLHGNCGNCHGGPAPRAGLALGATVGVMDLAESPAVRTGVCQCLARWTGRANDHGETYTRRIDAGDAERSGVVGRMQVRGAGEQMPPMGTAEVDVHGLALVSRWIDALDPELCAAAPACALPSVAAMLPAAGAPAVAPPVAGAPAP